MVGVEVFLNWVTSRAGRGDGNEGSVVSKHLVPQYFSNNFFMYTQGQIQDLWDFMQFENNYSKKNYTKL